MAGLGTDPTENKTFDERFGVMLKDSMRAGTEVTEALGRMTDSFMKDMDDEEEDITRDDKEDAAGEKSIEDIRLELEDTKAELEILKENMPGGIMTYNADTGKINYVNQGLLHIFGCEEEQFRERYMDNFSLFVMKDDRARVNEQIESQMLFYNYVELTYRVENLMDEITYINHRATLRTLRDGTRIFMCFITDVSELVDTQNRMQRVNEQLYFETERFKLIEEAIDNIEYDYDVDNDRLSISKKDERGVRHWNRVDRFISGKELQKRVYHDDIFIVTSVVDAIMRNAEKGVVEYRLNQEDGGYLWYRMNYASFADKTDHVHRIVGSAKEITAEKHEQEKLRSEAETDGMTGLLNKKAMQLSCAEHLGGSEVTDCHALFMIDTDNFKSVNDTLGHSTGDDTIKFVADCIRKVFRENDLVGRMGGDEFMVLMNHATEQSAIDKAKSLNDSIRTDIKGDAGTVHISCSIGIAFFAKHGEDYDSLFKAADSALYEAKEAGKDCYRVYAPSAR